MGLQFPCAQSDSKQEHNEQQRQHINDIVGSEIEIVGHGRKLFQSKESGINHGQPCGTQQFITVGGNCQYHRTQQECRHIIDMKQISHALKQSGFGLCRN